MYTHIHTYVYEYAVSRWVGLLFCLLGLGLAFIRAAFLHTARLFYNFAHSITALSWHNLSCHAMSSIFNIMHMNVIHLATTMPTASQPSQCHHELSTDYVPVSALYIILYM